MRLGLWGARADNSGLGQQTYEFYKQMQPAKTVVVDISMADPNQNRRMKQYPERYSEGNVRFIQGFPNEFDIKDFLQDLDVVFIAESSYNLSFYQLARQAGVKTAVQYNYEFFDWFGDSIWECPDLFIAPSSWHYSDVQALCDKKQIKHVYLHCPVNRQAIKRRYIDSASRFVHVAGRPAAHDRNGTYTFLEALQLAPDDLKGTVYTQDKDLFHEIQHEYPSVEVKFDITDYQDIYKKGAVLVLPRKYGGNCLPMNEALAAGMPVIMTNQSPNNNFLPMRWLTPVIKSGIEFAPRFPIDMYQSNPAELMLRMRWFKSLSNADMKTQSDLADQLADTISWDVMKPKYIEVLEALCQL